MESDLSWLFAIVAGLALLVALPQLIAWVRRRDDRHLGVERAGILIAWLSVPFLILAFSQYHDVRYLGPVMPAVAILTAGLVTGLSAAWPRRLLVGALVVLGVFQTALLTVDVRPPLLPSAVVVPAPVGVATIPLAGQPEGYERLPGRVDYATPIVSYLASKSRASNHRILRRTVCILQTDPVVNGNTLGWIADEHRWPFVFLTQFETNASRTVVAQLPSCDFALYIPPTKAPPARWGEIEGAERVLPSDQVVLLNQHSVAAMITRAMLAIFHGPSRRFPVGGGADVYVLEREGRGPHAATMPIGLGR